MLGSKYGRRVGPACDVWGVGCLLLALCLGRQVQLLPDVEPDGAAASWDAVAALREYEGELLPSEMAFVAQCLTYDDSARPSAVKLNRHEYLQFAPASVRSVGAADSGSKGLLSQIVFAAAAAAVAAAAPAVATAAAGDLV
ncbi:hypothetical protein COO60DRAFT_1642577 [Scenedesmus sp. NREL 46B-D3]|nr:hypothetical protein COO60DRAFT_1642577 [Scenedesmus sp. NREL 46B-D3]